MIYNVMTAIIGGTSIHRIRTNSGDINQAISRNPHKSAKGFRKALNRNARRTDRQMIRIDKFDTMIAATYRF